ncbi:MAG: polysaccharide biosynthesis/export family protein [Pyrinomonadaceae bacterium]|nr:polysaccharide biosynthesis/export family protein [Sphingobacteriaceae bacterium]
MKYNNNILIIIAILFCQVFLLSCANVKKTQYFSNQNDGSINSDNIAPQTLIRNNDILSITVSSLNPNATAIFNAPNSFANDNSSSGMNMQPHGYLVNSDGNIQFPVIGNIKVTSLTTNQLRSQLTKTLTDKKLLVDPVVSVRHLNHRVTVLGEVARPGVVNVPSEKISLLEALGAAGDVTVFGRKDNIMIIREENGSKVIKRLNLNSNELLTSPYYYLKSNDIVYVEANKAKVGNSSRSAQLLPIILSGLSFAAIIIDRLVK